MRTVSIPMALALTLTSLTACAPGSQVSGPTDARAASERQCFWASSLRNFRQGDYGQLYIRDRSNQVFEVTTLDRCQDLDRANAVAFQSDFGSAGRLCVGDTARITVRSLGGNPDSCRARIERRLTADEIAALPDDQRP